MIDLNDPKLTAYALGELDDSILGDLFVFPWGVETDFETAIQQTLFHAIGHFAQIRERAGVYHRSTTRQS